MINQENNTVKKINTWQKTTHENMKRGDGPIVGDSAPPSLSHRKKELILPFLVLMLLSNHQPEYRWDISSLNITFWQKPRPLWGDWLTLWVFIFIFLFFLKMSICHTHWCVMHAWRDVMAVNSSNSIVSLKELPFSRRNIVDKFRPTLNIKQALTKAGKTYSRRFNRSCYQRKTWLAGFEVANALFC